MAAGDEDVLGSQAVQVYVTEAARWEHLDGSCCPAGPGVPPGVWTAVRMPLVCAAGRPVRLRPGPDPFWLDLPAG